MSDDYKVDQSIRDAIELERSDMRQAVLRLAAEFADDNGVIVTDEAELLERLGL